MAATLGNCFICGKTAGKTAIKNHIIKEHSGGGEECYLIKAEGMYDKDYWLYFSISLDAALSAMDRFLRQIWCECCGHLSAFRCGGAKFGMSRKLSSLAVGDTLLYEYDFGSTTEIVITIVDRIFRQPQREKVRLLARNTLPEALCKRCGAPAEQINTWENEPLCGECAKGAEDDCALLPITNSPRCGECGYDGEQDKWTFSPNTIDQSEASRAASNRARDYEWVIDEKAATKPSLTAARRKLLKEYAKAAVNLYGIVEFEDFVRIVNRYETDKTDVDEIAAAFSRSRYNVRDGFFAPAELVINKEFYLSDDLRGTELFHGQHGKQRYFPSTKEDFLKYADENYFEQSEYTDAVYAFIRDEIFTDNEGTAKAAFTELMYAVKSQVVVKGSLDRSMAAFSSRDYIWKSQKQIERFMNLYMALQSNTRMWWNCGHTPLEVRGGSFTPPITQAPIKSTKVGRNEPCPCGSGLKYKKCCGQ